MSPASSPAKVCTVAGTMVSSTSEGLIERLLSTTCPSMKKLEAISSAVPTVEGLSPGGVGISSSGDEEGCQIDTISVPSEGRGVGGGLSPIVAGDGKETGPGCYGTDVP